MRYLLYATSWTTFPTGTCVKEAVAEAQASAAEVACKVYHSVRIIYFIGLKLCNKINKFYCLKPKIV